MITARKVVDHIQPSYNNKAGSTFPAKPPANASVADLSLKCRVHAGPALAGPRGHDISENRSATDALAGGFAGEACKGVIGS